MRAALRGLGVLGMSLAFAAALVPGRASASAPAALPSDLFGGAPPPATTIALPAPQVSDALIATLENTLGALLRSPFVAGHTLSAQVVGVTSGQVLFSHNEDMVLKPASNAKLFTTAAAYGVLGENWRTASRLLTRGKVEGEKLNGDIVLHGVHDVSWSTLFYPIPHYVANRLVDQLYEQGIREITGDVLVHGLFVVDGHRFGTLDTALERRQAGAMFGQRLAAKGIRLHGEVRVSDAPLPSGYSDELAIWEGPALSTIAAYINRISHNEFADMILLALAQADGGGASYANGALAIERWLTQMGLPHEGLRLRDGSGLSHDNRVSAQQLTALVAAIQNEPWADQWNSSLSLAGVDGTYANRMHGPSTRGCAWLKSGTINGVITTAGLLNHRGTGERYAVAFLMNDVRHQPSARASQDQLMAAVGDVELDTARPAAPELHAALLTPDDQVELRWTPPRGKAELYIQVRDASSGWRTEHQVASGAKSLRIPRGAAPRAYRVVAVGESGMSDPSGVLIAGGPKHAGHVIVIDGNERWLSDPAPENGLRTAHGFLTQYLSPLTGYRVESATNRSLDALQPPPRSTLLFSLGEEARSTEAMSAAERAWLDGHLTRGGAAIVAGSEFVWDLATNVEGGAAYLDRVFGVALVDDSAGNTAACLPAREGEPAPNRPRCAHFWTPGAMKIEFPDALQATRGESCMRYGGMRTDACVVHGRAAVVGFPLESIDAPQAREAVVRRLLQLVGTPDRDDKS